MAQYYTSKINQLAGHNGEEVTIAGWLQKSRSGGKVLFLVIRDGSGFCQCIVEKAMVSGELFSELKHLGQESSLCITGQVRKDERSVGGYEILVSEAKVFCDTKDYPITPKPHGVEFLMANRHLHLRSQRQWALNRVRHTVIAAIRDFFNTNDFILIDTPIFTTAAGEGEQNLFNVDYFGETACLSQTGQLYLECGALSHGRVYCFGPTFRAEKSKTRRHLTEFWMVEPEVAFITLDELMELAEDFVCSIIKAVLENNISDLELLGSDIESLRKIKKPFYRLTYSEAVDILTGPKAAKYLEDELISLSSSLEDAENKLAELTETQSQAKKQWQKDKAAAEIIEINSAIAELKRRIENNPKHARLAAGFQWGKDLGGSDETIISMMHDRPVFVTHYPKDVKAFYMKSNESDAGVVDNFDMLAPAGFGEIIGGSMREDSYEMLLERINEKGYNPQDYSWYLDLRKYGSVPHGGFGLGVERTIAWLTGEKHIRQCIAFPRLMDKIEI
ncbi:Asparagine--tRNA ligase [Limihaloglobus sulfuriphilus]|uniref:Asparagine--tRNA ligase n=1 Tax=Limihaloglobus sulfuriphilus TaxID=1851148 RepID=A0A1Q2MDQ2_9BACT|nr:asparagine--tRNA ligase [Limihaloglobus sulfuriphilus]AQQ70392.1 Asparagine--tRNA ligase [Limihaloglobus sulfuriphilus]